MAKTRYLLIGLAIAIVHTLFWLFGVYSWLLYLLAIKLKAGIGTTSGNILLSIVKYYNIFIIFLIIFFEVLYIRSKLYRYNHKFKRG